MEYHIQDNILETVCILLSYDSPLKDISTQKMHYWTILNYFEGTKYLAEN